MSVVLEERKGSALYLTLNRPDKRNALNDELIEALKASLADAHGDADLRAVVITGAGKDFCSGADLAALQKISEYSYEENLADAGSLMDLFLAIRRTEVPVIAAVRGRALAGGCGLATACDIVLAADSARFGYPEVKIGFVPAMVMAILRRNVSEKRAFELITRGFDIPAEEALGFGLINRVFGDDEFEERVAEYVSGYDNVSRSAVTLSKQLLYSIDGSTFAEAMRAGAEVNAKARMTDDCKAGIARFLSRKD
jgi:methylglutaconyl-CoA hydratase